MCQCTEYIISMLGVMNMFIPIPTFVSVAACWRADIVSAGQGGVFYVQATCWPSKGIWNFKNSLKANSNIEQLKYFIVIAGWLWEG